ncbi:protein GVQW3 [Trichonephila clavipes]|nr:protein GVQW3 [Trichonephila clavipes]
MNVKICVPSGKSATETNEMLKHVYDSDTLSRTQAFEWHLCFRKGTESVEHDERSGRPQTCRTAENIEKVSEAVRNNMLKTISLIAEPVGIFEVTCQRILTKDLNTHRVLPHIVSRMLNEDQKAIRMEMAGDLISAVDEDPSLLGRIAT